jgi:Tfp pilus assembly protein PilV
MLFRHPTNSGRTRFLAASAYSLIEVLISVVILAVTVLGLYSGFIFGFACIKTNREDMRATQMLDQKLEAIRLCTWGQLSNCPATFKDYYDPTGVSSNSGGAVYYGTISTTATPTMIPDSASYKSLVHLITINVTWTNYTGKSPIVHQRQMQTLAAYNGLQNYIWGSK